MIIIAFELQKDWAKDHKTHKYFYVGAESDTFGSYFTKEFHSRMVLAYQEGDVLDDGVEVVGRKKEGIKTKIVDYEKIAKSLGVDPNVARAIAKVESSGSGFYKGGGVKIRFEGHQFKRHLKLKGIDVKLLENSGFEDIIYDYGSHKKRKHGLKEYKKAFKLNSECAMMATSYGAFQIMGFNYKSAGYLSVKEFVKDHKSYNGQVKAFLKYVSAQKVLLQAMKEKNFTKFARHYNGPDYKVNQYDVKMKEYFEEFSTKTADSSIQDNVLNINLGLSWAEGLALDRDDLESGKKYIVKYEQEKGNTEEKLRTANTSLALEKMDCSEFVCRYLHKIGWSKNVKWLNTKGLLEFAKNNPKKLVENNGDPKPGDVFVWDGHTGIIKSYNGGKVVTIEGISEKPYSWHEGIHFRGIVIWEYEKGKNHLKNKGMKQIKYFTPN